MSIVINLMGIVFVRQHLMGQGENCSHNFHQERSLLLALVLLGGFAERPQNARCAVLALPAKNVPNKLIIIKPNPSPFLTL
jgi:hypothetical protein